MRQNGIMIICDRCGKRVFAEELRGGMYDQRGLTDWGIGMKGFYNSKDLCPECFEKYREHDRQFYEGGRHGT